MATFTDQDASILSVRPFRRILHDRLVRLGRYPEAGCIDSSVQQPRVVTMAMAFHKP